MFHFEPFPLLAALTFSTADFAPARQNTVSCDATIGVNFGDASQASTFVAKYKLALDAPSEPLVSFRLQLQMNALVRNQQQFPRRNSARQAFLKKASCWPCSNGPNTGTECQLAGSNLRRQQACACTEDRIEDCTILQRKKLVLYVCQYIYYIDTIKQMRISIS